ncbi:MULTISPECIES: ParA family protein [unclassified Acinetobacter]|uniref:ParA family protein n=1 Tax=unclassified Acinetobacter TaxID=196816 RepID=UPI0029344218|nr:MULTISPECIES: ParA family protein [unclassified Acinetobacter]WOE33313.1 ParA family protein [Acinetobacter sp. SAAs470]WOE37028.1 ParA family protein [Acinetobacter sp. SAAs474]
MTNKSTKILAVANHKGGCGKTTTVVHLASELAALDYKVLVIDLDPQANASLHIGLQHPSEMETTSAELLIGDLNLLSEALQEETNFKNVSLIYGSLNLGKTEDKLKDESPRPSEELDRQLALLEGLYDFILIDCPPSLKILTSNALAAATHVIIPIESGSQYGLYGVTDLINHLTKIRRINPEIVLLGALLIKHDERQNVCKLIREEALNQVGSLLTTTIPLSTKVNQAAILQQPLNVVDKNAKVRKAFQELAKEIVSRVE